MAEKWVINPEVRETRKKAVGKIKRKMRRGRAETKKGKGRGRLCGFFMDACQHLRLTRPSRKRNGKLCALVRFPNALR